MFINEPMALDKTVSENPKPCETAHGLERARDLLGGR